MNLDQLFHRRYDKDTYNCGHFVVDVWKEITGKDLSVIFAGLLLPANERYAAGTLRRNFVRHPKPHSPSVVLFHRPRTPPHAGVFYKGRVFHITPDGVQYQPLDVAGRGFKTIRFYS